MPELPEVEIVRQSLNKKINQKKVIKVVVRNRNLRFKLPINFETFLKGRKIIEVKRFSKYLIFCFSNDKYCLLPFDKFLAEAYLLFSNPKISSKYFNLFDISFFEHPLIFMGYSKLL